MTKTKGLSKSLLIQNLRYFKLKLLQKWDLDILDAHNMMEDVIGIRFSFFLLQSINKGIESLPQTQKF